LEESSRGIERRNKAIVREGKLKKKYERGIIRNLFLYIFT